MPLTATGLETLNSNCKLPITSFSRGDVRIGDTSRSDFLVEVEDPDNLLE